MVSLHHRTARRSTVWPYAVAVAATTGLGMIIVLSAQLLMTGHTNRLVVAVIALAVAMGACAATEVSRVLCGARWPALAVVGVIAVGAPWALARMLLLWVDPLLSAALVLGAVSGLVVVSVRTRRAWAAICGSLLLVGGSTAPAAAWSVDEPNDHDPAMVAGNGIVVKVDTHAFLLQQGVTILRNDGYTGASDFLLSADPSAPYQRDSATGAMTKQTESYLWRMQRGSRDADRVNKPTMPDHFFNWWTHSGKGLVAGPSAADYAEEQHDLALAAWRRGDRSEAAYHLGAAAHLVADACTPPHSSPLVPQHRAYEEWVVANQSQMKASRGGIYQDQFRVTTGHGGPEWSSSHTRGWVDECAHRAADQIVNTIQPPSADPLLNEDAARATAAHFRQTQQMTAGYLRFFLDEAGAQ